MTYETVYDDFLADFPELIDDIALQSTKNHIAEDDGMHVKFGLAIVPVLIDLVIADAPIIEKICDFFEKMAICPDIKVQELLDFTILESLIDEKPALSMIKRHMRKETLAHCLEVEKLMM